MFALFDSKQWGGIQGMWGRERGDDMQQRSLTGNVAVMWRVFRPLSHRDIPCLWFGTIWTDASAFLWSCFNTKSCFHDVFFCMFQYLCEPYPYQKFSTTAHETHVIVCSCLCLFERGVSGYSSAGNFIIFHSANRNHMKSDYPSSSHHSFVLCWWS